MNNQDEPHINFYGSLKDTVFSEPYVVLASTEIAKMVRRFEVWISMIQAHPNLAEMLGEGKDAHIKMVTALPTAIQSAKQSGIFPKVVLSQNEFQASVDFYAVQCEAIKSLPEFEF